MILSQADTGIFIRVDLFWKIGGCRRSRRACKTGNFHEGAARTTLPSSGHQVVREGSARMSSGDQTKETTVKNGASGALHRLNAQHADLKRGRSRRRSRRRCN